LGILLIFFPLRKWLGVPQLAIGEFSVTVLMLSLYSLAYLQTGMIAAIYRAAESYSRYLAWSAHARVLESILVAVVLVGGGRFIAIAGAMLVARILGTAILYEKGRRLLPNVRCRLFSGKWADLVPLLPSGLAFLSFPVANALINQGTVLVVNHLAGPSSVVLLSVCRQIARVFQQGTSTIFTAFQPEMTRAYSVRNGMRIRQLQSAVLVLVLLVAVPFVAGVTVFGNDVIHWWTRKDLGVTRVLIFGCALEAVFFGAGALCSLLPWAINRVRALSLVYAFFNAGALLAGAMFMRPFGLPGLVGAFCMAGIAYCAAGLFLGCRLGAFTLRDLWMPREIVAMVAWWRIGKA
jgi:O-antigen/teichoic acid export membrane protein